MKTFHNDPKIKEKYLKRLKQHAEADNIIQGIGWENGKGCAVGCTLENYGHGQYEIELGIPEWLAHLEDRVFEGLDAEQAKRFPVDFLESVPIGIEESELYKLRCDLDCQRLSILLDKQRNLHPQDDFGVSEVLKECIRLNGEYVDADNKQWSAAESLAWLAARSAERSAALSAAVSAESLAWSAAESLARSAALSAAWIGERDRLLEGLRKLTK